MDEVEVECPYCGEPITLVIDLSVESANYVEDCSVCCQPMLVSYAVDEDGVLASLSVEREGD
jgi:hypothetical protein